MKRPYTLPRLMLAQILAVFLVFYTSSRADAVPEHLISSESNAAKNFNEIISRIEKAGLENQASKLKSLLEENRLYWYPNLTEEGKVPTGDDDAPPAGMARIQPEGKDWLLIRGDYLGGRDGSGDVTLYQDGIKPHVPYAAIVTVLHELVHHDQPPDLRRTGTLQQKIHGVTKKITPDIVRETGPILLKIRSELEAYQKSNKIFAENFILKAIGEFIQGSKIIHPTDKEKKIREIQSMIIGLQNSVKVTPKHCGDLISRWQAILTNLFELHGALEPLQVDAGSKASCAQQQQQHDTYSKTETEKRKEIGRVSTIERELTAQIQKVKPAYESAVRQAEALRVKLSKPANTATRAEKIAIAEKLASLDSFVRTEAPRVKALESRLVQLVLKRESLERNTVRDRTNQKQAMANLDNCRLRYVSELLENGDIEPSRLPPDMTIGKSGKPEIIKPPKDLQNEISRLAEELRDLFDFDPDELKNAADPRTPAIDENVGQSGGSSDTDSAYVIYIDPASVGTQVYMVDKRAAVDNSNTTCKTRQ